MAFRRKVSLIYSYNEDWIGGTYYIQNLVAALNKVRYFDKPALYILCSEIDRFKELKKITGYRHLFYLKPTVELNLRERVINKFSRIFRGKNYYFAEYRKIGAVFPASFKYSFPIKTRKIFWIPDFQEHFLPQFFKEDEIEYRKLSQKEIIQKGKYIVFSSLSAQKDFNAIHPGNNLKQFVLPFAVTNPKSFSISFPELKEKYSLPSSYFICCNQFWQHKNHKIIIEALYLLKKSGNEIYVAFTGKETDYRNPHFVDELKLLIAKYGLEKNVRFLGFIPRQDQLMLIKNARAIIQPSLFEGWSTVIEDAKSLGSNIIASEIEVHKEQLLNYHSRPFFSGNSPEQLAELILNVADFPNHFYNYDDDILTFAKTFVEIINNVE